MENKNIKIIARQIAPEYQESPFEWCDSFYYAGLVLTGNRDYKTLIGEETGSFETVLDVLEKGELLEVIDDLKFGGYYSSFYKNVTEAIKEYFPREKKYNTREVGRIKKLIAEYYKGDYRMNRDDDIICELLKIIDGMEWKHTTLTGCCQGDYQGCFYRSDMFNKEALERIEAEYFNTGDEWLVRYADQEEDDYEYSQYTAAWNDEGIKKEIADEMGVLPEEVQLEKFSGWARSATYEIA